MKIKISHSLICESEEFIKESTKEVLVYYEHGDMIEKDIEQTEEGLQAGKVLDYRKELMNKYNLEKVKNKAEARISVKRAKYWAKL